MTKKKTTRKKRTKKKRIAKRPQTLEREVEDLASSFPTWPWPLRPYQQDAVDAFDRGIKRQVLAWHRRAGKDVFCLSLARREARKRIGGYVHFFPKHVQARRALWQGIDPKQGRNFIDIAFGEYEAARNNTEMYLELYNGSTWQLLGSDNYDRVVGSNAVGVVFSEWALCNPKSWDFIRPIILENDGFAIFISTFRSRNHMWQMSQALADNPEWYVDIRGIDKTTDIHGNPILTEKHMEQERLSGMSEGMIQQEYYCNPEAISDGAIYGKETERLRGDVTRHDGFWNPSKPVYCVWNLDLPIFASCVYVQPGDRHTILATQTWEQLSLGEAIRNAEQQPWPITGHILGPDHRSFLAQFQDHSRHPQLLASDNHLEATTRTSDLLNTCLIDYKRCEPLLDSLSGYVRRERFDAQTATQQFAELPAISWHGRLVAALEIWAQWAYNSRQDGWSKNPDYSVQDRIARVTL